MTKRIFAISTLVLVLLIGAIFIYNFAFKKPEVPPPSTKTADEGKANPVPSTPGKETPTPTTPNGASIAAISDTPVFGATLGQEADSIYVFAGDNGQLNQIDFNGKLEKVLSTEEFQNIRQIFWNKPKNKAIVVREDSPGKSKFLLLDIAQKTVTPLKDNIDSVAWTMLGDKIIYKYFDSKTKLRTLNISDPDGSNWKKIADVNYVGVSISLIPGSANFSFWPNPDAFTSSAVTTMGFSGENKKEILKDRYGADLLWSPDGTIAAVTYTDQKGGKQTDLGVMNSDGGQFHSLNFPTFAKKCTWSADSKLLYCAMPGNIPGTAILPNDWQEGHVQSTDTFWKIEAATGKKDRIIETSEIGGSYNALNPFLSQDGKTLFFTNKIDGKLYKLGI